MIKLLIVGRISNPVGRQRLDDRLQEPFGRSRGMLSGRRVQSAGGGQVYRFIRAQNHRAVRCKRHRRRDAPDWVQPRRAAGRSSGRTPETDHVAADHG